MTAAQYHRLAAKTRPPDAIQKKPASGNHFPSSNYAKLSQAGEAELDRWQRLSGRDCHPTSVRM